MTKNQQQWRHGFMTGIKRATGYGRDETIAAIPCDELDQLRRDALLVSIMRDMGAFDSGSRPGGNYWKGTDQAFAILNDMLD